MLVMNFLRALADLGFYYSFAGVLSTYAGGRLVLTVLLFQSACFGVSSALRRSRAARTAVLIPGLILIFLPVPLADRIVSIPPMLYLAYLAWTGSYQISWRRQVNQLTLFGKVFLAAGWVMTLGFWEAFLSAGIPAALLTAAASVLLTRSLRHTPEVYLQRGYQLINIASILLLAAAALVLGSEQAVRTAASALSSIFSTVVSPVLQIAGMAVQHFFALVLALLKLFSGDPKPDGEQPSLNLAEKALEEELVRLEEGPLSEDFSGFISGAVLAAEIIAAAVVLFLLFRWMARRWYGGGAKSAPVMVQSGIPEQRRPPGRVQGGLYAYQIRRQYRAFLRLGRSRGLLREISDTSTDVGEKSLDIFHSEEALTELRDIYQKARYHGAADRKDYAQFKRLLNALKKAKDNS